jgi:hypothetical protein
LIFEKGGWIGWAYREEPDFDGDSGWRFFRGDEDDEFTDNPENFRIYSLETIVKHEPKIRSLLNSPPGAAFERDNRSDTFSPAEQE